MIGHFLLAISPAQEDRLLTEKLAPGALVGPYGRCLLGAAEDWRLKDGSKLCTAVFPFHSYQLDVYSGMGEKRTKLVSWGRASEQRSVADRFDNLCYRFGDERITQAIRNRILANQARRMLPKAPVLPELCNT